MQSKDEKVQAAEPAGARYRLMSVHLLEGNPLPAGTEVGAGTPYPWNHTPSNQMAGVNDEGRKRVNEVHQRLYGKDAPWHDEERERLGKEERETAERQREEEKSSEPVSYAQAHERGADWKGEAARLPPHLHRPTPSLTRGGDTSQPMGPAIARQDLNDPEVQPRATQPLRDQMPRDGGAPSGGTQQPKG